MAGWMGQNWCDLSQPTQLLRRFLGWTESISEKNEEIREKGLWIVVIGGKSWYNRGIGRLGRVGKRLIRQRRLDMGRVDNTGG